jgi:hypothetical protein
MADRVYLFGKGRSKKIDLKNKPVEDVIFKKPKDETVIQEINGITPDSKEEYWVALALYRLDLEFIYQYSIRGGSSVRGGQIVDFLVYTAPLPTPLLVQGEYWHRGTKNAVSQFKVIEIQRYFGAEAQPPVEIWDFEIPDRETTYQVVKRKLT